MDTPKGDYAFAKHLSAWLRELGGPAPRGFRKWTPGFLANYLALWALILSVAAVMPNRFFEPELLTITITLGVLGIWRFGWWFTHAVRAECYRRVVWPPMRRAAQALWASGWRPRRLHIQMTTYYEEPAITRAVIGSILNQVRREGIPTSLWIGTGSAYDELVIRGYVETHGADLPEGLMNLIFVRQNQPGKRMAIGLILRGMARRGVDPDDLVIFMDGDAVYGGDVLEKTLPMFGADPELQALTTDEEVLCYGPRWIGAWLEMRFAQRRLAMQSHALSRRVLTLTGRMSVFRARYIVDEKFIRTIEADHLDHWLWGRFRFLSGDDKSTWFHLLSKGARMTYVPDATVYTIEVVKGSGLQRMVQNFRRWSGNMLRNGARAIALGPRAMPFFIWWCVVDQRLAMWTMMVSPVLAVFATLIDPVYIWNVLIWVVASRLVLSTVLYTYARKPDLSWPFILYFNQFINAGVKIYMIFHLSKQKWSNRGNQSAGEGTGWKERFALFQLFTAVWAFITGLAIYSGMLVLP
jgi:glycosyltransferase Alg8